MEYLFIPIALPFLVWLGYEQHKNWRNGNWRRWSKSFWRSVTTS